MSDFEILRLRDSASISATIDSGSRTVRVFMRALYYASAALARQRPNLGSARRKATCGLSMAAAEKCSCIFGMSAIHGRQKNGAAGGGDAGRATTADHRATTSSVRPVAER